MFKKIDWKSTFMWAAAAALISSIPVFFYIRSADYTRAWLLYLSSVCFFFSMAAHVIRESNKRGGNESTMALVFASHVTIICGILISCVISFLMLTIFVPGFVDAGNTGKQLINEPPQTLEDKTGGIAFHVFVTSILLNFFGGSIAGTMIPFYVKRNQTKDNREPAPFQQKKTDVKKVMR